MLDSQYDGVILEDKWGRTYLCSNCLFAYTDLGPSLVSDVKDKIYGRAFLHDLEPAIEQRKIWAKMYQQAHPYQLNLSGLSDFELRDRLIDIFNNNEMWIWQLSDGWGQKPDNNGIGDGGLSSDPASASSKPPVTITKNVRTGGGAASDDNTPTKAASHEAKPTTTVQTQPKTNNIKKVEPASLEQAQQILAERRKQIEKNGYQPKYSDSELLEMADAGDVANERFHVRFMAASNLKYNSLGAVLEGNTGKGAKYWSTTFDQMEAADSDPEIICKAIGIDYDPATEWALVIIDTEQAHQIADTKCVVASFSELNTFCKEELSDKFTDSEIDLFLTAEYQEYYAEKYAEALSSPYMEWSNDTDGAFDYFTEQNLPITELDLLRKRLDMHKTLGNNQHYLGNGLTKNLLDCEQQYGVVETVNFERKVISFDDYGNAIKINSKLKPING